MSHKIRDYLKRERAALDGVTPGPWTSDRDGLAIKVVRSADQTIIRAGFPANSDFIAHARNNYERNLALIEKLVGALEASRAKLKVYRENSNGEYMGGMEYQMLMSLVDEVLATDPGADGI